MTRGELVGTEPHPAAVGAFQWVKGLPVEELSRWREAFASTAIEGNRLAEVCGETLDRILNGQTVSDRYLLGLAWAMRWVPDCEQHEWKPIAGRDLQQCRVCKTVERSIPV